MTANDIVSRARSAAWSSQGRRLRLPHRHEISPRGVIEETRSLWQDLRAPDPGIVRQKFLIVSRARSGSTLLTRLLNAHPEVRCDRERLARPTLAPIAYLERLARQSTRPVWGAKLLSYQMIRILRLKDPAGFLRDLDGRGFRLVHLRRDTFSQALSAAMALKRQHYHNYADPTRGGGTKTFDGPATLDPARFRQMLEWSALQSEYEEHVLDGLDPIRVSYDADLCDLERQQATAKRLFAAFGVAPLDVEPDIRKVLPEDPRRTVANFGDVLSEIDAHGLGHLVRDDHR